jgi:uncharacterized membrane protein
MQKLLSFLVSIVVFAICANALAATYTVTPLGGGFSSNRANDVGDNGTVVGRSDGRAFVWRPTSPNSTTGTFQFLPVLSGPGTSGEAFAVNSSGFAVGSTAGATLADTPVVWNAANVATALQTFRGVTSGGIATGINNTGVIVGRNGLNTTDASTARWATNGTGQDLGNPTSSNYSFAGRINNNGVFVGTAQRPRDGSSAGDEVGYVYENGAFSYLPLPGTSLSSNGLSINDSGVIVGNDSDGAAYWDVARNHHVLPGIVGLSRPTAARDINNGGRIVGYMNIGAGQLRGLTWNDFSATPDYLGNLIDPSSPGYLSSNDPGWTIIDATGVNEFGQISALALPSISMGGGSFTPVLLTPVPEPTMLGAIAIISVFVVSGVRRQARGYR